MEKITVKIEGMMCGMCENHINDAIRRAFSVKKVTSSHKRGETVIIGEKVDERKLKEVIDETGYRFISSRSEPYEKRGLFRLKKTGI